MCGHHELSHKIYATLLVAMLLILAACGNGNGGGGGTTSIATRIPRLAAKQILTFPMLVSTIAIRPIPRW